MNYESTTLWKNTLGKQGDELIDRLRVSYQSLREHIKGLLDEVRKDFPNLTVHSIEHADDLWKKASMIIGEGYPINPLEGYILGCTFLVHDSVLSYKAFGGKDALRKTTEWTDCYQSIAGMDYDNEDGKQKIDFKVIRQLHAQKCADILCRQFEALDGTNSYLLTDDGLRKHFGALIGKIASSHHWETASLTDLPKQVNPLDYMPSEWIICPMKIACVLRCADAAAIDSSRAPDYLFRLLRLNGVSKDHWSAQNRLGIAPDLKDPTRLIITSTYDFEEDDFSAWNVSYDAVKVISSELEKCNEMLADVAPFKVRSIAGAASKKALSTYIKTKGWMPRDISVHISDVAKLIKTLGGKELYGKEDLQFIVLRELIQNSRDAINARRLLEKDDIFAGRIIVSACETENGTQITVTDNGVGMSLETIANSLLNFGNSFWQEDAVNDEFPGLNTAGFRSVGQYGIGFFSVFMIAKSVIVESRKFNAGLNEAHLVKFPKGLTLSPIFANHASTSTLYTTKISFVLDDKHASWPKEYEVKRNQMHAANFNVPISAMLSTLVAGLDVDVYYQESDEKLHRIHQRIDDNAFDKREWLRSLSFADYQHDKELDNFIESNYQRLEYIYDDNHSFAGLAAIATRFLPNQDFLGGATIGGLLTGLHSRSGEYWIGILEKNSGGAKRDVGDNKAPKDVIARWATSQAAALEKFAMTDVQLRFRLQIAMQNLGADPIRIAFAFCLLYGEDSSHYNVLPLGVIVGMLSQGKKLIFIDSDITSRKENEGHGDVYMNIGQVGTKLMEGEMLYVPIMNSGFLSYKLKDGVPEKNNGFIDCLYRVADSMGYKLCFSYRPNYITNNLGMNERALVIEAVNKTE